MSEESVNASVTVPQAIYRSAAVGYTMTILTTILIIYSLGPDISSVLTTTSGQPYQQLFLNATGDETKTVIMVTFMLLLLFFSQITTTTASSRQMFTFARDNGLPGSRFLAKVHLIQTPHTLIVLANLETSQISPRTHIPWNSVVLTLVIVSILALIPLGSIIAFNIITSLSSIAIFSSYWISIACRLANRFSSNPIKPPRWNMGRAGTFVNVAALTFLTIGIIFILFPSAPHPTPASFNWTLVIWAGVTVFALIYYFVYGKKVYISPRSRITKVDVSSRVELVEIGEATAKNVNGTYQEGSNF
jgi:choline transport protein